MNLKAVLLFLFGCAVFTALILSTVQEVAAQNRLFVGWASTSITPDEPVALAGQFYTRIASDVREPITATVLALEMREGGETVGQAIMVSCDLVAIEDVVMRKLRDRVRQKLSERGFDAEKLIANATHTHTAPVMEIENRYDIPEEGVMQPAEYVDFLVDRLSEIVLKASQNRAPGGVSWRFSYAVVGHNRRAVYYDGRAEMCGATDTEQFSHIEGPTDHGVPMLFFWDENQELMGIALNVSIPLLFREFVCLPDDRCGRRSVSALTVSGGG